MPVEDIKPVDPSEMKFDKDVQRRVSNSDSGFDSQPGQVKAKYTLSKNSAGSIMPSKVQVPTPPRAPRKPNVDVKALRMRSASRERPPRSTLGN